jgi:hypothetical protein
MRYQIFILLLLSFLSVSATGEFVESKSFGLHSQLHFDDQTGSAPLTEFGIKEIVPKDYSARYRRWKDELLKTEFGRDLWNNYSSRTDFLLTIKVAGSRKNGAGTDDFAWDVNGQLIAATVTLGKDLDKGFPDPVYYPVMNSLAGQTEIHSMTGDLLAATKMAHEIGHVTFTAKINSQLFRKQNRLMENYYNIFLKNGFDTRDPRLVSLESELGARPLEIWEDREYWSEVSALRFLVQKIQRESFYCAVMDKIRWNVDSYATRFKDRFDLSDVAQRPVCRN